MPPTVVSLFAGCGGFDAGFADEGFKILSAYDIDHAAVETYNCNLRAVAQQRELTADTTGIERADVVIAGPPCQGFSTVGKHGGTDNRNNLLKLACEIAVQLKPKVFVLENVPGVGQMKHAGILGQARSILQSAGYYLSEGILECQELGVAQRRRRFFLVARSRSRPFELALPSAAPISLRDVIGALAQEAPDLVPHSVAARIAMRIEPGQKLSNVRVSPASVHTWDVPEVFGRTNRRERALLEKLVRLRRTQRVRDFGDADPVSIARIRNALGESMEVEIESLLRKGYLRRVGRLVDLTNTFNGKFRRLSWDHPSPTVDTKFGQPQLFLHPSRNRGLTAREAARIQGFGSAFILPQTTSDAYRLIGNAVPPPVSSRIAKMVAGLVH